MKSTWSVAVLFQDRHMRRAAVEFCDRLIKKFWGEADFELSWLSFEALTNLSTARESMNQALAADILIIGATAGRALGLEMQNWSERWLVARGAREGIMIGLLDEAVESEEVVAEPFAGLRQLAHRAGMDYHSGMPPSLSEPLPDSPESYCVRAGQLSSVLTEILHRPLPPPQIGASPAPVRKRPA